MGSRDWLASAAMELGLSWKYRIWAAILLGVATVLSQLPLFGVLGFEFSFVIAVVVSIASADLGASLVFAARHHKSAPVDRLDSPGGTIFQLIARAGALSILLLVLPLLFVSLNAFRVRNCDWLFGLRCYLSMPVLSAILASGLGVCAGVLSGERRWRRIAAPFVLLFISVLITVVHFYRSPAVFNYNPFGGYFPGNLYDESIDLRAPFYWARLYHFAVLITVGSFISLLLDVQSLRLSRRPRPGGLRARSILLLIASGALALLLYLQSGSLGFSVSAADVRAALPARYESEHFVIHYPADPELTENIEIIAADHEFRRAQLVRDLGVDPPGKITSFYFASPDQKFEWMGARNVYMAKPWRNEIYVHHQGFPHEVLRHEIAHVMAGSFGDGIFHVSAGQILGLPVFFNVGMIEGTAVAADWPDHFNKPLTPHQSVKAMQSLGIAPPAQRLFSTGFLAFSSARSYTVAGSYLRFLLDRYGIHSLQKLYESGGDFRDAYGRSQTLLSEEWQQHIDSTPLPEGAAEIIVEQFRRPAIFDRPCPHAVARSRDRMGQQAARGEFSRAIKTAQGICSDVPKEPVYQLQLAALLSMASRVDDAAEIYTRIGDDTENISSSLRAHALFALVAIRMWENQESQARSLLERIVAMPLGDDDLRQAYVQQKVLLHTGPAALALRGVFWSTRPGREVDRMVVAGLAAEAASLEPNLGLSHYLLGRLLRGRGNPDATRRALSRALQDPDLGLLVQREAARLLAESAFLAGKSDDLKQGAAILVHADQPEVTRLLGYDWLERLFFEQTGRVPDRALGWVAGQTQSGMRTPSDNGIQAAPAAATLGTGAQSDAGPQSDARPASDAGLDAGQAREMSLSQDASVIP